MLTLTESIFMLTIDDIRGTTAKGVYGSLYFGLAGAVLMDLLLLGKIAMEDKTVVLSDSSPIGDDLLDQALEMISMSKKPRKAEHWMNSLPAINIPQRVVDQLVAKKVLSIDDKHYKWVIPFEAAGQQKASAKYLIKHRLRAAVLAGGEAEAREIILLNLLRASSLLKLVFTKDERRAAQLKVEELVNGDDLKAYTGAGLADIITITNVVATFSRL